MRWGEREQRITIIHRGSIYGITDWVSALWCAVVTNVWRRGGGVAKKVEG